MSPHLVPEQAMLLAALPEEDTARVAAEAHAAECADCRALLADGAQMMLMLDELDGRVAVRPALKARIEERLAQVPASRGWRWSVLALAALSLLLVWLDGTRAISGEGMFALGQSLGGHCAGFEAGFAALPLGVGALLSQLGKVRLQPAPFAATTMAFAVVGQLVLSARCPLHDVTVHLFVVHFLTVLLVGLLAAGTSRALVPSH
jgi:predicted anti-sigma-YlaC factor YlaD